MTTKRRPGLTTPGPTPKQSVATNSPIVTQVVPEIRPLCRVVGSYCEALYWLRTDPDAPANVCCRHYWADLEAAS